MITISPPSLRLSASITLPGSKSYTNRALIVASIAGGTSTLINPSSSDDSTAMRAALEKLGVSIIDQGSQWLVSRAAHEFTPYHGEINVGPAGTTMRFLTALLATIPGCDVILAGSERMHQRPIESLVSALQKLGASIEYLGHQGCPPLRIRGRALLSNQEIAIDGSKSSQFISALLLSSPRIPGLSISITGEVVSQSYLEMALDTMRQFGSSITSSHDLRSHSSKNASRYLPRTYQVEADASGASYFWGLAALGQGSLTINGINPQSVQGDMRFPELLRQMGCHVVYDNNAVTVSSSGQLNGITCDMTLLPDTAQTLAVIAACAKGITRISGLSTLRIKETDRLLALRSELELCGITSIIDDDSIEIQGGHPRHAQISTYEDHRMAMSFALLGALPAGISIHEPEVVSKSFPDFWNRLRTLGFSVHENS